MVDYISLIGLVVAFVSLCVAIMAYAKSYKTQDQTIALQQRLIQIEEGRDQLSLIKASSATLRAELREFERSSYKLCIANDGASVARNVRIELGDMPLVDHQAFPRGVKMPNFIGPKSEITCPIAIHLGCAPSFALRVLWDDDCGPNHNFMTTLSSP